MVRGGFVLNFITSDKWWSILKYVKNHKLYLIYNLLNGMISISTSIYSTFITRATEAQRQ